MACVEHQQGGLQAADEDVSSRAARLTSGQSRLREQPAQRPKPNEPKRKCTLVRSHGCGAADWGALIGRVWSSTATQSRGAAGASACGRLAHWRASRSGPGERARAQCHLCRGRGGRSVQARLHVAAPGEGARGSGCAGLTHARLFGMTVSGRSCALVSRLSSAVGGALVSRLSSDNRRAHLLHLSAASPAQRGGAHLSAASPARAGHC